MDRISQSKELQFHKRREKSHLPGKESRVREVARMQKHLAVDESMAQRRGTLTFTWRLTIGIKQKASIARQRLSLFVGSN